MNNTFIEKEKKKKNGRRAHATAMFAHQLTPNIEEYCLRIPEGCLARTPEEASDPRHHEINFGKLPAVRVRSMSPS